MQLLSTEEFKLLISYLLLAFLQGGLCVGNVGSLFKSSGVWSEN